LLRKVVERLLANGRILDQLYPMIFQKRKNLTSNLWKKQKIYKSNFVRFLLLNLSRNRKNWRNWSRFPFAGNSEPELGAKEAV